MFEAFAPIQAEYNADFTQRIAIVPDAEQWRDTAMPGVRFRLFEDCPQPYPRRTLMLECAPGSTIDRHESELEVEFLVLEGEIADEKGSYPAGTYVRNPFGSSHAHSRWGCRLFVKLSQIQASDQTQRIINTRKPSKWLPGPVEGTRIFPLHGWETESVLLIDWQRTARFKPDLNPAGEEIFVIQGTLRDADTTYPTHSWIRNPVESWQYWEADAGAQVYFKQGHFPQPG